METSTNKALLFSAELQRETENTVDIDDAGEIVLTCTETGHVIKLPAGTDGATLKAYLEAHKTANAGQVTKASLDAKKAELLKALFPESEASV